MKANSRAPFTSMLTVLGLAGVIAFAGCASRPPSPDWLTNTPLLGDALVDSDTPQSGTSSWLMTFTSPALRLGSCATASGAVTGKQCLKTSPAILMSLKPEELSAGAYQTFARVLSVDFNTDVKAATANAKGKEILETRQLVMQWARWREDAASYGQGESVNTPFVAQVRVGVGVRLVLDVVVSRTTVQAGGTFGFGDIAAALAARKATAKVSLSLVGFPRSILPQRSPIFISSADEYGVVVQDFYDTIKQLNALIATQTTPFDGDVVAYRVVNMSTPQLTAAYSAGYVLGLRGIAAGKPCADVLSETPGLASMSPEDRASLEEGMTEVYARLLSAPKCGDYKVPGIAMQIAKEEVRGSQP